MKKLLIIVLFSLLLSSCGISESQNESSATETAVPESKIMMSESKKETTSEITEISESTKVSVTGIGFTEGYYVIYYPEEKELYFAYEPENIPATVLREEGVVSAGKVMQEFSASIDTEDGNEIVKSYNIAEGTDIYYSAAKDLIYVNLSDEKVIALGPLVSKKERDRL